MKRKHRSKVPKPCVDLTALAKIEAGKTVGEKMWKNGLGDLKQTRIHVIIEHNS